MTSQRTFLSREGVAISELLIIAAAIAMVFALVYQISNNRKAPDTDVGRGIVSSIDDYSEDGKLTEKACSKAAGAIVSAYGEGAFQIALSAVATWAVPVAGTGGLATRFAGTAVGDAWKACVMVFENPSDSKKKVFYRLSRLDVGSVRKAFLDVEFFARKHAETVKGIVPSASGSEFLITPPDLWTGATQ